jgi:hypothetical protein
MEVVVVLTVLAVLAVGAVAAARWHAEARSDAPRETTHELLDPVDLAELEELLGRADAEERAVRDSLICTRLDLVLARKVPVRRVTPSAIRGAVTVGFADGTALTVASCRPAEGGVLLMWTSHSRVLLDRYHREDGRLLLTFRKDGRRERLEVVALGLDQPA